MTRLVAVRVSNSHTVAVHHDGTNIPLAAGKAQAGETNLYLGCLGHVGIRSPTWICRD